MKEREQNMETMQKKLKDLDSEVNTFIQVVREVKEMKDSAGLLHDRLIHNEEEIELQRKELGKLISSSGSLIAAIEEQTRGIINDLEKKSDALVHDVKTGISQIGNICESGSSQLQELQKEHVEDLTKKFEEMKSVCQALQTSVDMHEKKINSFSSAHSAVSDVCDRMNTSIADIKKTIGELQKRPYEIDYKLKKLEERLELSIQEKLYVQKRFTWTVLLIVMAAIFFALIALYLN